MGDVLTFIPRQLAGEPILDGTVMGEVGACTVVAVRSPSQPDHLPLVLAVAGQGENIKPVAAFPDTPDGWRQAGIFAEVMTHALAVAETEWSPHPVGADRRFPADLVHLLPATARPAPEPAPSFCDRAQGLFVRVWSRLARR